MAVVGSTMIAKGISGQTESLLSNDAPRHSCGEFRTPRSPRTRFELPQSSLRQALGVSFEAAVLADQICTKLRKYGTTAVASARRSCRYAVSKGFVEVIQQQPGSPITHSQAACSF